MISAMLAALGHMRNVWLTIWLMIKIKKAQLVVIQLVKPHSEQRGRD